MSNHNDQADAATYQEALDYIYGFINLEHRPQDRYAASKMDSTRPQRLMTFLDNPHQKLRAIHIAGTKGKGSVAIMCAACLRSAGLRVGLYTSPHVMEFRERIRILTPDDEDGRIAPDDFITLVNQLKPAIAAFPDITWFEIVTAMAFLHFAQQEVDAAVVEVGLGGRLDATNVLTPMVSVITSLSLDHTHLLGNTIEQIAYEKGGIIKPDVPVVVAKQTAVAERKLLEIAAERQAPITLVGQNWHYTGRTMQGRQLLTITHGPDPDFIMVPATFLLNLMGSYQRDNAVVALAALEQVRPFFSTMTRGAVASGLSKATWPGRLQMLHHGFKSPSLLLDCAHNADSAAKLAQALATEYTYERLWLVIGATADKNVAGILGPLLPLAYHTVVTQSSHPRAATPDELTETAARLGVNVEVAPDVVTAVSRVWEQAGPHDLICAAGSIFVVGDLLNEWDNLQLRLVNQYSR
jgi:dihydrofolate synthase / folylpolyglutamate synthase